jgi:hypothetical protein
MPRTLIPWVASTRRPNVRRIDVWRVIAVCGLLVVAALVVFGWTSRLDATAKSSMGVLSPPIFSAAAEKIEQENSGSGQQVDEALPDIAAGSGMSSGFQVPDLAVGQGVAKHFSAGVGEAGLEQAEVLQ